jgi:hypothetical protein
LNPLDISGSASPPLLDFDVQDAGSDLEQDDDAETDPDGPVHLPARMTSLTQVPHSRVEATPESPALLGECDYQELKQEVGLGHFEGRGWRGFHHHATLCIAAYGFLISERETIPPSIDSATRVFPQFALCESYQPRGSAVAA